MNATVTTYALYLVIALPLTVWVALGGMHFFNLLVFAKLRERATWKSSPPPLHPAGIPYHKA